MSSGRLPLNGDQSQETTSSCNVLRKIVTLWWPVTGDHILLQCPHEDCHSMVTSHRRPHPPAMSSGRLSLYDDQSQETTSSCNVLRKIVTLWWPVTGDHILLQCPQEDCHSMMTSHRRPHPPAVSLGRLSFQDWIGKLKPHGRSSWKRYMMAWITVLCVISGVCKKVSMSYSTSGTCLDIAITAVKSIIKNKCDVQGKILIQWH